MIVDNRIVHFPHKFVEDHNNKLERAVVAVEAEEVVVAAVQQLLLKREKFRNYKKYS